MTAIVLLPGMDGSGSLFADFISALSAKTIVVSYPRDVPLSYEELESLARKSLPTNEPFIIVGESFSGPVALMLAASNPGSMRAIVLVCSFATAPGPALPVSFRRFVASLPFWRAPMSLSAALLLGRFGSERLRAQLSSAIGGVAASVWKARFLSVLSVDLTQRLPQIQVPILYLRASEDRLVSRSASEVILRNTPKARVTEIEGPHFLLQARPHEAAAAIRAFARESRIAL